MVEITEIDFEQWADLILDRTELPEALRHAYAIGYTTGHRAREKGWYVEYDNYVQSNPHLCAPNTYGDGDGEKS